MPKYKPLYSLYKGLRESKYDVPDSYVSFQKTLTQAGDAGAKSRRGLYQSLKDSNYDVPDTYEDFYKNLFVPVNSTTSRALKIGENPNTPTVNRYRQKMFDSVDPNKNGLNNLSNRAVGQAVRATNNVRKPVIAKVVNQKGKPTGKEFAITPAKTAEDLDREYAQETTKNWENELHDQIADADKDAAKISDMFKSFIGSTDEVGSVWGNMTRGGGIAGTPHSVTTNNGILENTEARQILAAGDYNRKRRELLQLEQDSRNGAIFDNHSFFRGMYDAAKDTGFLTGGASDLINAGSLLATKQDLDNGVHTEAGDMLMQQAVRNSNAQSQYGDNQGWMYTGGVITTNMAPFMVQIGSAGFSEDMSNAIGKVVQGTASKVALGTMEKATGMAGAHIANYIGKVTGLTTKAFGKAVQYGIVGAAQANTVGLGNVANDVINRYTGQVYQDEQGSYKFGTFDSDGNLVHEGGEDFLTSLVKGDAAQTIEFATELAGGGIDAVGTALKNFVTKGGKKIINKYNMENVSKVIDFLLNNKVSKNARYLKAGADRTLGKVELNSIVGESLEEELGIIANTVFTGDNKISDLWNEKQQSQIWGGMLLSIGLMKGAVAPFYAYNAKQYYSYKHKLDKADVNLSQLLGKEKWEELRNQIDATTNEDMPEMVNKINRDVALGKNRQPVREYIQNLLIMRGYDIGNMLAAKKAVEDKGEGVSVKNMEKNQAYQQGRGAYGYDTHEIQLDQEDKQKSLAQLLGISEQQLASMSDEELEALSGRDDNIDRAIYDYQLSTARYEGVIDNARDQIDLEVQRAAQAVDMYTDKSRNTIRNATIKATGGLEDYGVYIINGNIATHEDGSIDISNSDDMILYYDPTTNTVEHADAMMFAELGSEENADEVRSQAMADAKEKAIKETTGIIDGVVEVGTQFKTVDTDGTEHTYEVLADNGYGTAVITIDGNVPTELVKGENVQVPVSFEELQKMKDESDQQRLQAAKAQREQMEKERAEQQMQAQTTQAENPSQEDNIQPAPIEDNLDYSDIIRDDGKVQMVDVSDKDGNNLFPDAKDVFYIQGNKMRTKFAYIDANGELKTQSFPTGLVKIKTRGEVSVDDYKKYRNMILSAESSAMPETSMIEDNSGSIEADRGGIEVEDNTQPLSEADADNVIAQMESSAETAPDLELTPDNWTAEFGEDGILSTPVGDVKMGENQVAKLFEKGRSKEFGMIKPTLTNPDVIIEVPSHSADGNEERSSSYLFIKTFLGKNGKKVYYFKSVTIRKDGLEISISSHYDRAKRVKETLMKGKLLYRKNDGAQTEQNQPSTSVTTSQEDAAGSSESKDTNISSNGNENNESLTFEDGTPIPVDMNGETDLSQTDAAHAAEWYDNNLGEDADDWLDGEIKKAKKVLEQAKNKKLAGTKPSELVASKKEKEAAIADAQAHYDSAISIRDSLKERRIAKEENTSEGRKELIEKARRKFARLKSAVKDDAEAVSQLYRDTIGSLLHRLYDGTGIDVTDTIPLTAEEYVASNLGAHSLNYEGTETSKGVKQETGLSREDFAKTQLLAADGKGTTIDALVHSLWENRPSNLESLDTQDIRNALIGVLNSGFKASEARNFVENIRIAQAENILEEQKRAQENAAYAEQHKAESEAELKAKSDEKAELKAKSEEKLDNESDNKSNDLSNESDNEKINDNINDNINTPEQNKFPDNLKEWSKTIEVPEDATEEKPLGEQISKDKVPFEIKGEKSGETYDINDKEDRKRLVAENSVDDKDILDIDMPKHVHKAIKELCKKMGLKVQFLYMGAELNGWIENGTMYLALDANKAIQFVFGHEMTHAIKQKNPEAYKELIKVAMAVTTRKEFEEDLAKVYRIYHNASGYNNIDDFVEEVIADNIGKFINDHDLAQRFVLRLNHPVLATILHAIQKIKGLLYGDPYKSVDALERIVEKAYVDTANGQVTNSETGEDVSFSLRQKPEPKKKGVGYKVFVLKDGKLYPPMVANPNGAATPVGVWLDADAAPIAGESKTGRPQVKQGGKGTQGGSGKLAYRPGWHLGVVPYAIQFNRKDAEGNKTLFPKNFVFAEVEYAADVDYQEEARQEGINPSGKYQHSLAGLKHLPTDGYYMYRTNPNPETDPWVITGAMKVNRILTRAEQAELVKNAGREPQQIQEGDIVTDDVVNSINQEIAAAPKFSLKTYHGTGANFDRFDTSHAYEGAGSETFGHGIYVTKSAKIGASYALKAKVKEIKTPKAFKAIKNGDNWFGRFIDNAVRSSFAKAKKETFNRMDELIKEDENIVNDETKPEWKQNAAQKELADFDKLKSLFEGLTEEDIPSLKRAKANRYEVEIPDDTGNNYLDWNKPMKKEQKKIVREGLEKLGVDVDRLVRNGYSLDKNFGDVYNGLLYYALNGTKFEERDSFVASSNFLSSLGFTGIKYYAGTIWGGAKKGDLNYVIFNEDDAKIVGNTKFSLKKVNDAFNQRLDELVKNPNQKDKILRLGRSSSFLKAGGIADADIELEFDKFVRKSGDKYKNNHPFNASDLKNLPMAIAEPIAVFKSTNANDHVVLTELQKDGKNFIVAIRAVEQHRKGGVVLEVNQITSLYPKEEKGIINWVNTGRISNVDKEKALHFIEALQPHAGTSITDEELKSAANIINSFETTKENGEKFSLKDEKTLEGVHNISEDKLLKAIKQGGLANPSVAVIDSSRQDHKAYGGISLILPSDKIAKRTGKNAGTWQGDAYTPTYPEVEKQMSNKGAEKSSSDVLSVPKEMQHEVRNGIDRWLNGGDANSGLKYLFLHEKGVAPEPKMIQPKFSDEAYNELKFITAGDFNIYGIGKADAQKVLDMYIEAKFDGDKDLYEEKTKAWLERNKSIVDAGTKGGMRYAIAKENVELYDEYGFNYKGVQTFVRDVEYDHRKSGVDTNATLNEVEDYIKTNNLTDEFNTWLEGKEKEYGIKEVIFDGFTPSGNRRYVPNTLENVSKLMKKQGRNGATGAAVSFQNFAARLMPSYGTLKDIRSKKGLLTSDREKFDKFREKWSNVFFELGMKCQPDATGTFDDYGLARLSEAAMTSDPQAYLKKEYNVDFSDEDTKRLKEMVKAIKEEHPAMYFETKFERPVRFDEFSAAVVPTTTKKEVKEALKNAGVSIFEYDEKSDADRKRAFNEAINSSDNIRFSLAGERGAADMAEDLKSLNTPDEVDDAIKTAIDDMPSGWQMANKKMIHIAQALGENRKAEIAGEEPKFSLKDGTLIKAGTYFSGGGLVEEGLKGIIDPVVAVEYDEKISGVYRNNFGQHIVTADVRDVDPKELVKQIDGEVEYFHASPVCKNYSQAKSNHAEVELDKETAASTAEFINAIKPKVVTIENVKGYKDSEAMKTITDALDANGYTWDADVYNAADYGGYTNRERLIVRAVRDGKLPAKPKKMAHKSGWYEAVADIIPTLTEKKNGVAPWMDIRLKADGIDWRNIDKPLYVMGSAYADGKIPHAFADELLPTLRTKSGDVIVMPDGKVYRAMGRVLARVSGVSDDYKMPFSENLSHTIIGNGIPTQLTEHVIAPLVQNTLRPTTPEDGNTKFSLRGSTPYDKQMEEWMEKNHLEKGAVPMEKPIMKEGENIFDYANRMVEWTRNQNLWKTAPKQTGFQDALDKWKADNGLSPDAYPPVRPHRENYSTEIGYAEDLEEYNKKKELWKSAPKPKDFDLSVDLEDMNKQLRNIRRAVLNQKNYDQRAVKAVSDLVRKMLNIGWGDGLSRGKVGNLLSAAKNATGANDVKKYLDKAMGILAENYLNRLSTAYDNLINTNGARADQSGVIKIGSLDAKGQAFMSEYKKAINMDDSSLNTYIANIEEDSAKNEDNVEMNDYRLAGIQAAIMYKQQIGGNDADISELKRQIGELKNKKDATKEDKDLLKSLEKKLFENKFDRITMYENLLNNIQRMVKESKGRAKEFREEIAEHKNEILHRANLDLEGVDSTYYDTTTAKKKFVNNDLQRAVFSSTYTFEQFLKFFGKHSANGEGRLYNYFHKLNQDALDEEQLYNEMNRNALDEKTKELFGKNKFMNLVGVDGKGMKEMDVEVTDYSNKETGKRTIHLKQGQMLYIYLVNKETDGEMKLRAMGITEEDVAAIEENLDPRVKAMGEWLQDEYLPECQRRYQATHTKYFGAPMKEVENYFPLAINNRARNVKEDVNQDSDAMSQLAGTSTGAIVTRRVNVIPLDIENADAFEVAFNHLQEMEEWSAMLPFRQDINTLLSYTHFRNQVQNMSSVAYGSGKTLWDEFKQTAQIAAGTYKPKVNAGMMDSRIAAAMGGIAVAKISGRLWTAIKQSQSATVFLPECDFTRFVKNGVNPYGSWKWAMENIPDFRKRVENMTYGYVKLRQYLDELEKWHDWTKTISKIGMAPNILVDGITCAVGARSVYETEVNRLTKLGYPMEKAEEKAYYKAVAAYNKTQQSSGGMYLSPMQVDRTYVSAALSLFKNANYAYGRMQIEACRGLARTYDLWGGKHKTTLIESMTRQIMEEDGLDENTARAIAKATYNRTFRQSIGRLINFATLVPVSWALYKVLPYLLTGDDDDKKKNMIEEAVLKGFATSLSDNYVIPFASNILNAGLKVEDGKPTFDPEVFRYQNLYINPATSDLSNIYSMVGNQKWYSVANKLGMLGVQSLIGFNPETVGALYQALSEADYDNGNTAKEWQIGILKAISAPEESIRELYMDELGLKSGDIKKIPLAELEKRYAERQINRDNLLSQIGMDAETFNGYVDKYQKSFEKKIKDKMDKWDEYDKKKADEFFDTTSDPKLKDMIEKKRTKDANAAADEQIAKEGLNQENKGKEPSEEAYDAVKMSIDVAEDNAISTYNKVLNKRYAALNDEYNEQTDAMKYIFMSKHPNFKAYKELESEYTKYGKKIKELKEKMVSADGYDVKQAILKQIRAEREKFSELQSKVR
jgi:site-specific DNA-cytosine methylase|nr:MAG TPA: cytosine DNA methyltransferase [Bacteriophage sp.]